MSSLAERLMGRAELRAGTCDRRMITLSLLLGVLIDNHSSTVVDILDPDAESHLFTAWRGVCHGSQMEATIVIRQHTL